MISSPWRPGIALATQVLEFCKVLDLFYKVLEFLQALDVFAIRGDKSKAATSPRRRKVQGGDKSEEGSFLGNILGMWEGDMPSKSTQGKPVQARLATYQGL